MNVRGLRRTGAGVFAGAFFLLAVSVVAAPAYADSHDGGQHSGSWNSDDGGRDDQGGDHQGAWSGDQGGDHQGDWGGQPSGEHDGQNEGDDHQGDWDGHHDGEHDGDDGDEPCEPSPTPTPSESQTPPTPPPSDPPAPAAAAVVPTPTESSPEPTLTPTPTPTPPKEAAAAVVFKPQPAKVPKPKETDEPPPPPAPVAAPQPAQVPVVIPVVAPAAAVVVVEGFQPQAATVAEVPAPAPVAVVAAATIAKPVTPEPATDPNVLTGSLPTPWRFFETPGLLGFAGASFAAFVGLVLLPAELLNSVFGGHAETLFGRFTRPLAALLAATGVASRRGRVVFGAALTAATAAVFTFADPELGFDLASLRLFLSSVIALVVIGVTAAAITEVVSRAWWNAEVEFSLNPVGLVIAAFGVLLSRLLEFSPGFFIGMLLGVVVTMETPPAVRMRVAMLRAGVILALCLVAWAGYSILITFAEGAHLSFAGELAAETLTEIPIVGLTGLVVGLLPFRLLEGSEIRQWSRTAWFGIYIAVLLAFAVIVVPSTENWENLGSHWQVWVGALLAFSIICVGAYFLARRLIPEEVEAEEHDVVL